MSNQIERLKKTCKATNTSFAGIQKLIDYYIESLQWDYEEAVEHILYLFNDGTIERIKVMGSDGKET